MSLRDGDGRGGWDIERVRRRRIQDGAERCNAVWWGAVCGKMRRGVGRDHEAVILDTRNSSTDLTSPGPSPGGVSAAGAQQKIVSIAAGYWRGPHTGDVQRTRPILAGGIGGDPTPEAGGTRDETSGCEAKRWLYREAWRA